MEKGKVIWTDKKRTLFGLPISFTRYTLHEDKLYTTVKFLSVTEEELRLYRVIDISLSKTLFDRMFGVGSIICHSSDATSPSLTICKVKKPEEVRTMLSELVEKARKDNNIATGEFITTDRPMFRPEF